jgi:hypothetical protein
VGGAPPEADDGRVLGEPVGGGGGGHGRIAPQPPGVVRWRWLRVPGAEGDGKGFGEERDGYI